VNEMAARVIISDSEDEENVPIRTIRPSKTKRAIYSDEESITEDESDISSIVYVGQEEEELNKTHSPLQLNRKRVPGQRVIVSDDEEEEQTDATASSDASTSSHNSSASFHDSSASSCHSRGSYCEFYSVYSEPQGDLDDSNSPVHPKKCPNAPKQRVIASDNEDETDTARIFIPSSLPAEESPRETQKTSNKDATEKDMLEKDNKAVKKETLEEKDKENKSPDPQLPTAPDKSSLVPQLGPVSRPIVQPLKVPPTVTNKPLNETFSVAHTRPALLKQLEYVKVRVSYCLFIVLRISCSILETSCNY